MKLISHRGNINGKNISEENSPKYIIEATKQGYDVEIDLWVNGDKLFLGHDSAQYLVDIEFLSNDNFWIHAKNIKALEFLKRNNFSKYFWHQNDDFTLTSNGLIWTYPNRPLTEFSICVLPEEYNFNIPKNIFGICSDNINKYK